MGIQVSQALIPSTSSVASVVANDRHMCGICQLVCRLCYYIFIMQCYASMVYAVSLCLDKI